MGKAEHIIHLADPRLDDFRALTSPDVLARRGLFAAEGRFAVERLLASRFEVQALLTTPAMRDELRDALAQRDAARLLVADAALLREVTGFQFHRGCLALGRRSGELALDALVRNVTPQRPLLVLDGVTDPDNVDSIFRSAAAFAASGVLLSPGCADPLYRKAVRTSVGHTLHVPFRVAADWPTELAHVGEPLHCVALTCAPADTPVTEPLPARPFALFLGNEGAGLSAAALRACRERRTIPLASGVDSLNVAVAAAVAMHALSAAVRL